MTEVDVISWNPSLEKIIAEEAEKCAGLGWLHGECEKYFAFRTNWVSLPVIILSTFNGFLSGSSGMIFSNATSSSIGIGAVSLITGVISTVGSYFAWAKRTEAHRISAIQYQKLARFLTIEMNLPKSERLQAKDVLKLTKDQIERLLETSPAIPDYIIKNYKNKFKSITDVAQPEIIGGVNKVSINTYEMPEANNNIKIEFRNSKKQAN